MTAQIIRGTPRYLKLALHAADRTWLKDFFKVILCKFSIPRNLGISILNVSVLWY